MAKRTHPKLGTYEVFEQQTTSSVSDPATGEYVDRTRMLVSYDFDVFEPGGAKFYPSILAYDAKATDAQIDALADFLEALDTHTSTIRTAVAGDQWPLTKGLVEDLVISNPDMDILGEMFPGETLPYVSALTPEVVARHMAVTSCFAVIDAAQPMVITLDLTFLHGDTGQILACRFSPDGTLLKIDHES